jgi:hypothetical protein
VLVLVTGGSLTGVLTTGQLLMGGLVGVDVGAGVGIGAGVGLGVLGGEFVPEPLLTPTRSVMRKRPFGDPRPVDVR